MTRKRFILIAMLAIALCLALLLGIINVVLYTMATEDADHLTQRIADNQGFIGRPGGRSLHFENGRPVTGMLGTESPDLHASLRYFTAVFNEQGDGQLIAYSIDSVSREEALDWAKSLLGEKPFGWTAQSYRYRKWESGKLIYVTVIDQGRELLAFYRVLNISVAGFILALILSLILLLRFAKRLMRPVEDAERDRERMLSGIRQQYALPVTVMSAGLENLERRTGASEETQLMRRQLQRLTEAVRALSGEDDGQGAGERDFKALAESAAQRVRPAFEATGRMLTIDADASVPTARQAALGRILTELMDNAAKFAVGSAALNAREENGRFILEMSNPADLPDGEYDQVFDRNIRLANAAGQPGTGLGLNRVRDEVRAMNGRLSARVKDGVFTVRISL